MTARWLHTAINVHYIYGTKCMHANEFESPPCEGMPQLNSMRSCSHLHQIPSYAAAMKKKCRVPKQRHTDSYKLVKDISISSKQWLS